MGARKAVLLIDDDPAVRRAARTLIESMGLDVAEAADASAALAALHEPRIALICLDLVLPEASGFEVCEQIRRSAPHATTPILAMSERAYPEERAHASEAGADAFLAKPFTPAQLRQVLGRLLEAPAPLALAS